MHAILRAGWALAGWAAEAGVALAPAGASKLSRTFTMRRGAMHRLTSWGSASRDPSRPLVWMHASSVGEGLMARPVLERVRAAHPDWQVAYTFFSPSAERFARGLVPAVADVAEALPFDTSRNARALLDALRPSVLCVAKLDLWPVLAEAVAARGVPVAMVSATVPAGSGRLHPLSRALLRDAYAGVAAAGAVDATSGERLASLGVAPRSVTVTGDTRYDQVLARVAACHSSPWAIALGAGRPTLVAGSTWPSDEAVLLPAWEEVHRRVPGARLVIAPHEPTPAHLAPVERWGRSAGLRVARLGTPESPSADIVLVDRVGVLADLYAAATVAFVGGGFHGAGLHSVVEPAALGVPVTCGPRDPGQRDAALLMAAGGLVRASSAPALVATIVGWLTDDDERHAAGRAGAAVVAREGGASDRSADLVERLVERSGGGGEAREARR